MMMFFGAISSRSSGASCCRRQRLRSAMATARFAARCPTMYLSSSRTISLGVRRSPENGSSVVAGRWMTMTLEAFDGDVVVGVDADRRRDAQRFLGDLRGGQLRVLHQRARGGQRVRAARADGENAV